jgi:hypothetical protein
MSALVCGHSASRKAAKDAKRNKNYLVVGQSYVGVGLRTLRLTQSRKGRKGEQEIAYSFEKVMSAMLCG